MTRDELAAFDEAVLESVAADRDVAVERLTDIVRTHQSNVRELPGVEDIVYEWRNYFHQDPLVGRTEGAYYLALPEHVWAEFTDDLGLDETESAALLAVHDAQARAAPSEAGVETGRLDGDAALVLTRP
ncbi:hypothetical protein C475_14078 [Halosimplex carlsbadense 2-9-1]|uniref:DUF8048 domain-containing protein n=1 Tax=Halosimplex carlsbadense 2-9-1 TaxID=797114 RepID=M0CKD1_9EURY|nr:hypothetical protein [Halosimplex carlsbadense]ELZ23745.1 hypothetical protein C475_14078 [Halosimplex carlsbadense 2-9-1]